MARRTSRTSETPPRRETADEKLVRLARQRFKLAEEATEKQRAREKEDLAFYAGEQWPQEIKDARAVQRDGAGRVTVSAKPIITVNKTREPVKQVLNQERQSDMGAEIVPADDFGEQTDQINDDEIELREGLLRRIQRAPETSDAITWAFARAVQCGTGYFGIMTRYLKGQTFDQEPYVYRFWDQSSVLLDPAHQQPDGSDANWGFDGTDLEWDEYVSQYPEADGKKNRVCDYDNNDFRLATEETPGWFRTEGELRMVRVMNYYYVERETIQYALLPDGQVVLASEVPEGVTPVDERSDVVKRVKWCVLDGCQILEKTDWLGPDIPIVKVVGEELQPYDGERRIEGMVRPVIETNRAENYMVSEMVWQIALAPKPQLVIANGQDEGFESEYSALNVRSLPVLHYNYKDSEGTPVGPPTGTPNTTSIGPITQAIQFFDEAIKSGTSTPDATLGNVDPSVRSGRAVKLLQMQAQLGTSNYLDNLARSVRRMGVILNGLFYPLYRRPGRLARIVTGTGDSKTVTIGAATPSPAGDGSPSQPPPKQYILTPDAHFNVAIKVRKNTETRNDQINTMLGEMIAANPGFMEWFGDLFMKTTDSPDANELADRAKVMLAPPIQQMLKAKQEGQTPIPPEVQQKMAEAEQVIKGLTEQVEALTKEAETESAKMQAKAQADAQLEQVTSAAALQLEQMKGELALAKQQMADEFKMALEQFKATEAAKTREDEQKHEIAMASAEAAQKAEEAEATREHASEMGEQGHQQALEQQANAPKKGTNE